MTGGVYTLFCLKKMCLVHHIYFVPLLML